MATRRIGRAIEGLSETVDEVPTVDVEDLTQRIVADINAWLDRSPGNELPDGLPAWRCFANKVEVKTEYLQMLIRPAARVLDGHAFMIAGMAGDEANRRKVDVFLWLAERAKEYGLRRIAWECAFDADGAFAVALGGVEYSPSCFIADVDAVVALLETYRGLPSLPSHMLFASRTADHVRFDLGT